MSRKKTTTMKRIDGLYIVSFGLLVVGGTAIVLAIRNSHKEPNESGWTGNAGELQRSDWIYDHDAQITANFNAKEFLSKDGRNNYFRVSTKLVENIQALRNHFGRQVRVNSGYRSPEQNQNVGGVRNSYHMLGMAADISVGDVPPVVVQNYAIASGMFGGVGRYKNFTHVDVRKDKVEWSG